MNISDTPEPNIGETDVLIQVKASGICHTDYEILKGNYGQNSFPLIPDHEFAGVIVQTGEKVINVKTGDHVVVDPNIGCGNCASCARGWVHLCEKLGAYGVTTDGGFAEFCTVDCDRVHPLGDISFKRAALAEPMGCVLNALDTLHATWMRTALIFGTGPMRILMGLALQQLGVRDVTFCDINEERMNLAKSFGFNAVQSGTKDLLEWHQQADLAIEATWVSTVATDLPNYIVNGGKGLFFGVCPSEAKINISLFEIFRRLLTLAGSHSLNRNIPRSLEEITLLGAPLDALISHEVSLPEICDILNGQMPANSLKVQWSNECA